MRAFVLLALAACALEPTVKDTCVNLPIGASPADVVEWLGPEAYGADEGKTHVGYCGDYPDGCLCVVTFESNALTSFETQHCN